MSQPPVLVSAVLREPGVVRAEGEEHRGRDGHGEHAVRGAVEVSFARISLDFSFCFRLTAGGSRGADKG